MDHPSLLPTHLPNRKAFSRYYGSLLIGLFSALIVVGCTTQTKSTPNTGDSRNADDLLIIDCLLPGQVRRLGTYSTYMTARRPIKTTAVDCEIRGGEYVSFDRADYATALRIWLPIAESGDAEAQTYVGEIFEKGLGIVPDYEAAANWYRRAAEQGFSRAQINLGNLYEKGLGVDKDSVQALNWYRRASGVTNDDIQYVSSIQIVHPSQREIDRLREEVEFKNRQLDEMRGQLARTQQQLKDSRQSLTAAEQLRHEKEMALMAQTSKAIHEQSRELIAQLTLELERANAEVSTQREKLTQLDQQASTMSLRVANVAQQTAQQAQIAAVVDAPAIEIIDPAMSLTRGQPTVLLRSAVNEAEVVGKIKAPAGLRDFRVNGRKEPVDEYSLFWVTVPIKSERTSVKLDAVDKEGRTVTFDFSFLTEGKPLASTTQQTRAAAPVIPSTINLGNYHALIIGNNRYAHYRDLETAINDATETEKLLRERFGFNTTLLLNANRYDILSALNNLREKLTTNDNLLIYYAGHGELDNVNKRGYWLPIDAEPNNTANWISNVSISDILNTIPAKHVMVVADSCYAGTLSMASLPRINEQMSPDAYTEWVNVMARSRARTVLTSGGIAPVLDGGGSGHSVFARAFIDTLSRSSGIVEGHAVFRDVLGKVRTRSRELQHDQVPDYAPARYAGHEAGEFFFRSI